MAMYSVFNADSQRYDYFHAEGPELGQRVRARKKGLAGVLPEAVLPLLPPSAIKVGQGRDPRGILAVRGAGGLSGFGADILEDGPFVVQHPYIAAGLAIGGIVLVYEVAMYFARKW